MAYNKYCPGFPTEGLGCGGRLVKICAVILDYRGAIKTEACLRSLAGQGLTTVLIVDNSAEPTASRLLAGTVERMRAQSADFDLQVINTSTNLGFARGVNLALSTDQMSEHPHDAYLLLNNDAQAMPGLVQRLTVELEGDKAADLVAPSINSGPNHSQRIMWYNRYLGLQSRLQFPFSFPFLSGCCLLFRRDILEEGRLFDESFFMYGEDACLGWRLHSKGKTIRCVESATVCHGGQGSSRKGGLFYEYHMVRAHLLLSMKTWRNPLEIPLMLICKLFVLTARALVRSVRSRSTIPAIALIMGLFNIPVRRP